MAKHSIAGEWRGHYDYYGMPDKGCGFNAFISEHSGRLEGTIVDDYSPGKASLSGSFSYPSILFTKVYSKSGHFSELEKQGDQTFITFYSFLEPIEYEGTMTEDGKTMSGKWLINGKQSTAAGTWTAYRVLEDEEEQRETEKVEIVKEDGSDDFR